MERVRTGDQWLISLAACSSGTGSTSGIRVGTAAAFDGMPLRYPWIARGRARYYSIMSMRLMRVYWPLGRYAKLGQSMASAAMAMAAATLRR
jgi:hypothetical protein